MDALDLGETPSRFYWWRRRHPALTAFVCGIGAPLTLLACGTYWMKDVSLRQQRLSGPEVIEERMYASAVIFAGVVALAAFAITGHTIVFGEGELYTRLLARWYNGVSTMACLFLFASTWVITYLNLADDEE